MIENILVSIIVTLLVGFPLSAYASIIVVRHASFSATLNQARTLILNMEQTWQYRYLDKAIPDVDSPTGRRTVYMSKSISSNDVSWQLTQMGLALKELGHWNAAQAIDSLWLELDDLRETFVQKAELLVHDWDFSLTDYIADWHRTLSRENPSWWRIFKPWPNKLYQHLTCVEVDESTGEIKESKPVRNEPRD